MSPWIVECSLKCACCRFLDEVGVSYVLEVVKSSVGIARAVFPRRASPGRTIEESTITGSLMMYKQLQNMDVCNTHLVYVAVSSHFPSYIFVFDFMHFLWCSKKLFVSIRKSFLLVFCIAHVVLWIDRISCAPSFLTVLQEATELLVACCVKYV